LEQANKREEAASKRESLALKEKQAALLREDETKQQVNLALAEVERLKALLAQKE